MAAPLIRKPSTLSRPTWLLPAKSVIKPVGSLSAVCLGLLCLAGCVSSTNSNVLVDPLKQRLLAREDIALQNLVLSKTPYYAVGGDDAPYYDGPAVEPPLPEPDLNLLPEDLPPFDDIDPQPQTGGQ